MILEPRIDTNKHELIFKDDVYKIVGCAMNVLNALGHGFLEKIYENAMIVEFEHESIPCIQQKRFNISYREKHIGEYIPDIIAFEKIIVEIKTIDHISNQEKGQVLNYLKATGLSVGLILNFKKPKLEWERIVL